ncbi:short-chain dehydrogenase/reductase SDR [Leptothrix cholodnii SP-6]|uniref:Short-chain dehydrogenase/reductase SDR n=1 Tax=Leptothrix cholodnii (strain ATCC 51168 / LMG 8142 / SP-6) TaxID=395495 RepID=B1Y2D9_LEPCP|nr:SDR family NAD(P)-dependent oxidoreductase [Leptothrix cholodnii]ACB35592.1 short-chain dehydrogenase/reductase SDR [Leptothrix cholodnii SP-6]
MPDSLLTVLTGASRGLGLAIAHAILAREASQHLLTLQRQPDPALAELAQQRGHVLEAWSQDLADALPASQRLAAWLAAQDGERHAGVTLINNAGVLAPLRSAADTDPAALVQALRVGLEAPLLLAAVFLRGTRDWSARRRAGVKLLNVSSGLGRRGMAGSAAYCAAKAGLDNASRALALEEAQQPWPARVVSLAPGVIDTDMQVQLRAGDPAEFPEHDRFVDLQRSGRLWSAEVAAAALLRWLERTDFGERVVVDVRE